MIGPGKYIAKALGGQFDETSTKKTEFVKVCFKTVETGEIVYWTGWLTEKARERTYESLTHLGFNADVKLLHGEIFDETHLSDKEVEIEVVVEPGYKDPSKEYASVRWVNPVGGVSKFTGKGVQITGIKAGMAQARASLGIVENDVPY